MSAQESKKGFISFLFVSMLLALSGCSTKGTPDDGDIASSSSQNSSSSQISSSAISSSSRVASSSSSSRTVSTTGTDYSDMKNWSVFTSADKLTKDVDIFLLYPTALQQNNTTADDCPYMNINSSAMRSSVDNWYRSLGRVATEHTNPYLPYYRQANVFGGCSGSSGNMTGGAAMEDVIAAFQYYLDNINKGERPFILLGFSQGSSPLWELAENRLESFGSATRKNHIVTYATGIPGRRAIAANKPVKFSESYNDINVITAWNPYWESDSSCAANQLGVRASSGPTTNPITWTIDEDYHAMTENSTLNQNTILGARSYNKLGILLVKRKNEPSTPPGCGSTSSMYMGQHGQDIPYFSASIIKNIKDRIDAWKEKYLKEK